MRILALIPAFFILGISSYYSQSTAKKVPGDTVYPLKRDSGCVLFLEEQAEFPGGYDKFLKYVQTNIKYPKEKEVNGKIYVSFVIEKDGSISNVTILKTIPGEPELEKIVIEVFKKMPKWKPAVQNGKAVSERFCFPVNFKTQ